MQPETPSTSTPADALARAVQRAGSQAALAKLVGVAQPSVWKWTKNGQIGDRYAIKAEEATGVSRYDLRPDLYPRDDAPADHRRHGDMEPAR